MKALAGQLLLHAALGAAAFTAVAGLWGAVADRAGLLRRVRGAALLFAGCTALAAGVLWWALAAHDFSVRYVAKVGSLAAPPHHALVALWSGYEGSLLFFCLVLAGWVLAFLALERRADPQLALSVLGAAGAAAACLLLPLAGPASPFRALSPPPADGLGMAPLLQDHLLMLAHPPALYGGQAGLLFPFGVALAALARGRLEPQWRDAMRRWLLAAWALLTAGLLLGAWWAYAVLGWGGYWAWDPVENAALVPWLFATALLHVLQVVEREQRLEGLAVGLAVAGFAAALLGGFITRSGAIDSVHAFTRASTGWVFLVPPLAAVASALALRARRPLAAGSPAPPGLGRGSAVLAGAEVLVALAAAVLAGTLVPLAAALAGEGRVGVARPYYDALAAPAALLAILLLGVAPALPWGARATTAAWRKLAVPSGAGLAVAAACVGLGLRHGWAVATFGLAAFAAAATWPGHALRQGPRAARALGAALCHLGALVALCAIAGSSALATHVEVSALPGETFAVGRHQVRYLGLITREEPHRRWVAAALAVVDKDGTERSYGEAGGARLTFYPRREQPLSKPLVDSALGEDVYVALGGFDPQTRRAGFSAWEFPLVAWLWASLPLLVLGAALALASRGSQRRALALAAAAPPALAPR